MRTHARKVLTCLLMSIVMLLSCLMVTIPVSATTLDDLNQSKVLDVGYDFETPGLVGAEGLVEDNAAVFNKVENGVGFLATKGYVSNLDGVDCLRMYQYQSGCRIATDKDAKLITDSGITIEMYLRLEEYADAFYRLINSGGNFNLIRTEDEVYMGYTVGDENQDIVGEGDILPLGEWLHVAMVQSAEGQYLYVNGELKLEEHNEWNSNYEDGATDFNIALGLCDWSCGGNEYIAMGRIYTTAADQEEISALYDQCMDEFAPAGPVDPLDALNEKMTLDVGYNFDPSYVDAEGVMSNNDGIFNKVDGGVGFYKTKGYVDRIGGIDCLRMWKYSSGSRIATDKGTLLITDEGITVEMYVRLEEYPDEYYRLISSGTNLNLIRTTDKVYMGYTVGDENEDIVGDGNILPYGEWLHIVMVQSAEGQYLYVNGDLKLEGHEDWNSVYGEDYADDKKISLCACEWDCGGNEYLAMARIYKTVADQEQVDALYNQCYREFCLSPFEDLNPEGWYTEAVRSMVTNGLFGGITETEFAPDMNMTRSMFVTVLARLNGVNFNEYTPAGENPFTDVTSDKWFYKAVMWASENEIVNGMTADTFGPDGNITREQMCAMIIRYTTKFNITIRDDVPEVTFDDEASIASWAIDAVKACQKAGLVTGMTETTFVPGANASRAQVATILTRLLTQMYV